jgi:hypothetical protein
MACPNLLESVLNLSLEFASAVLVLDGNRGGSRGLETEIPPDVVSVLDEFADSNEGTAMVEAGRRALFELGKIPASLHWSDGGRESLYNLIHQAVIEAESYGQNNGALKRRFAIDLVSRVLRQYAPSPLFEMVEDVVMQPYLGVLIDWTVEVLNLHDAWPPVTKVKIPGFLTGRFGWVLRIQTWIWRAVAGLWSVVGFPSAYERRLRDALERTAPQIRALELVMPPSAVQRDLSEILGVLARVGQLTAPHVRIAAKLLKIAARVAGETPEQRRQLAYAVMRLLLKRAYADNWLTVAVLNSSLGDYLIRELVSSTDFVLERNGLLAPAPAMASALI